MFTIILAKQHLSKVGDPFNKENEQGPQVDGEQQEKVKLSSDVVVVFVVVGTIIHVVASFPDLGALIHQVWGG